MTGEGFDRSPSRVAQQEVNGEYSRLGSPGQKEPDRTRDARPPGRHGRLAPAPQLHGFRHTCGRVRRGARRPSISWSLIQPEAARLTRARSYDRAGFDGGRWPAAHAGRWPTRPRVPSIAVPPPFVSSAICRPVMHLRGPAPAGRGAVLVDPAHPEDGATPAPKEQIRSPRHPAAAGGYPRESAPRESSADSDIGLPAPRVDRAGRQPRWAARGRRGSWRRSGSRCQRSKPLRCPDPGRVFRRARQPDRLDPTSAAETSTPRRRIPCSSPSHPRTKATTALRCGTHWPPSRRGRHVVASNSGHWILWISRRSSTLSVGYWRAQS